MAILCALALLGAGMAACGRGAAAVLRASSGQSAQPSASSMILTDGPFCGNGMLFGDFGEFSSTPPSPVSDFTYMAAGNAVTITKYVGKGGEIIIPPEIDGKPVTIIGAGAFKGCAGLLSAIIPDSVTEIKDCAFQGCADLVGVMQSQGVLARIGIGAFEDCTSLQGDLISESMRS